MTQVERNPERLFAPPAVVLERRADASLLLRPAQALQSYARCIGEYLERWGRAAPDRAFLLERRDDGEWRGVTYGEALTAVRQLATGLLHHGLNADTPVAILADNSVQVGLLTLAAMHVGIPVAPISPAYSLLSRDFAKLRQIVAQLRPGLVYVAGLERFAGALQAIHGLHAGLIVAERANAARPEVVACDALRMPEDTARVQRAFESITGDTVAKLLFTSGSTGEPKGVVNTQRMLCSNQQAKAQIWPFADLAPPVIVDWLPWSHTFGGNHNFNFVLRSGGTLYVDGGRPAPGLFDKTLTNLREVSPTIYFNVPRGYDLLVQALRSDEVLRQNFFRRLQILFYAAAALPQHLWEALETLALQATGEAIVMVSAWGSTETAPLATSCHFRAARSGVIGNPVPGCELKLLSNGEKLEVRVRGPHVTPGYWQRPDLTAAGFDDEGFYLTGDAVRFVDPERPDRGLLFDGRVAEDFKLDSGTWVNVGALRLKAIEALAPIAQDVVLAGSNRAEIRLLIVPNAAACRALATDLPATADPDQVYAHRAVRERVATGLRALKAQGGGTSTYATRALLLTEPLSIDAGEITDKGYVNQRAVLAHRAALVEALYAAPPAGAGLEA
jgi:feruloyl-CoA synthase